MNWAGKQHPLETLAEWVAPALLAAAAGWAAWSASLTVVMVAAAAAVAFAVGIAAIRAAGGQKPLTVSPFEPVALERDDSGDDLGELLLEAKDEVLTLDDPLVAPAAESRVVRLFAAQEPTPGELVDRIADFLGDGRRTAASAPVGAIEQKPADASVALHAALANIRASLR